MVDYIDREAAVKIAEKYGLTNGTILGYHSGVADCIASEIFALPASDVTDVVHGRWVDNGIQDYILCGCSVCGFTCGASSFFYCPMCGAKMDGENNDE